MKTHCGRKHSMLSFQFLLHFSAFSRCSSISYWLIDAHTDSGFLVFQSNNSYMTVYNCRYPTFLVLVSTPRK